MPAPAPAPAKAAPAAPSPAKAAAATGAAKAAAAAASVPSKAPPAAKPTSGGTPPVPDDTVTGEYIDQVGRELEDLDAGGTGILDKKPKDKARDKAKPVVKPPDKTDDEPAEPAADDDQTPPADGEPVTKPGDKPEGEKEPKTNADLRKAYDRANVRIKEELEPKLQKYEARIKELEEREPQEVEPLRQKLTEIQKRNDELESEIAYVNYSSSKEFKEQYAQPYIDAFQAALSDIKELTVEDADGNDRPATEADLLEIANMDLGDAVKAANAKFGDAAQEVLAHRRVLRELGRKQNKALEEARAKGLERTKQAQEQAKASSGKMVQMWKQVNQQLETKFPKWFAPEEGDKEGNELLEKGRAMAARMFSPTEETRPKTPEEAVRLHALIYQKAANHDRLALRLKKASARVKELEESLKQYEDSEPQGGRAGGTPRGGGGAGDFGNYEEEIDALDRKGPIG